MRLLLPIFLALCSPCLGQEITLPSQVEGGVSAFIQVPSTTDGETVKWLALDPGLNVFPADLLKSTKTTVVSASKAGKYRLIAWTAKGDMPSEAAQTVVIIGTPGPDPPGPGPGPEPPSDAISKAVFDAAMKLATPRKSEAESVAKVYRNVASRAAGLSSMTVVEMADMTKTETKAALDATARAKWLPVGEILDDLGDTHIKDRESAIETYNKFAEGLEAVQ